MRCCCLCHKHLHTQSPETHAHTCVCTRSRSYQPCSPLRVYSSLLHPFLSFPLCRFEKIMGKVSFGRLKSTHCEKAAKNNAHSGVCTPTYMRTHPSEHAASQTHNWMTSPCYSFYGGVMTELLLSLFTPFPFSLCFSRTLVLSHSHKHARTQTHTSGLHYKIKYVHSSGV